MAPEVLQGKQYMKQSDVYSFGIIMWELVTLRLPWTDLNQWQVFHSVVYEHARPAIPDAPEEIPSDIFTSFVSLMQAMWQQDGQERPPFSDAVDRLRWLYEEAVRNKS